MWAGMVLRVALVGEAIREWERVEVKVEVGGVKKWEI